jgi:hypothetical protein
MPPEPVRDEAASALGLSLEILAVMHSRLPAELQT